MKKKILAMLLSLALCVSLSPAVFAAGAEAAFTDVPAGSWYERGVYTCARDAIMIGVADGVFSPDTELTAAECLTLALRLYDLQRGGKGTLETPPADWENALQIGSDKWYQGAVYTAEKWALVETDGFLQLLNRIAYNSVTATREDFARSLAVAAGELEKRYDVEKIPDVERTEYNENLYRLYEAGILNGMDSYGTFLGDKSLTRAEAAVMVARVLDEDQRLTAAPEAISAYDQAVVDLRSGFGYDAESERRYDTELCTIFVYDKGGFMYAPRGNVTLIYKAGSPLGEGTTVDCPIESALLRREPAELMLLSVDHTTFSYTYHYEDHDHTYTVDLATGETTDSESPITYDSIMTLLCHGAGYVGAWYEETPECSVVLRNREITYDKIMDYELYVAYKAEGADPIMRKLILPSTTTWGGIYQPTDRAPDTIAVSEDGATLTYVYHFDAPLFDGDELLHDAGTYTYTVDLATGELSVAHSEG